MQADFLNNSIGKSRRDFTPWAKPDKSDDVLLVSEYYGYNLAKARQALSVLTAEDLKKIRDNLAEGGQEGDTQG